MPRYIDADNAKEIVKSTNQKYDPQDDSTLSALLTNFEKLFAEAIDDVPTADVQETRHGLWEHHDDGGKFRGTYSCSECKRSPLNFDWEVKYYFKYCPHCGAKMDGGTDGN